MNESLTMCFMVTQNFLGIFQKSAWCKIIGNCIAVQGQQAVSAYLISEQILPLGSAVYFTQTGCIIQRTNAH